ncbi:hypothetical protein C8Q77DRAFT_1107035 [Trametes polyzona]|nr:hypothetical protein C8Q77DRAFT_1107035 [Trametes polyzona]
MGWCEVRFRSGRWSTFRIASHLSGLCLLHVSLRIQASFTSVLVVSHWPSSSYYSRPHPHTHIDCSRLWYLIAR